MNSPASRAFEIHSLRPLRRKPPSAAARACLQCESVGARPSFAQRIGARRIGCQPGKPALLLAVRAPAAHGIDHQRVVHIDENRDRRVYGGDGFDRKDGVKEGAAGSPVRLGDFDAHDAQREELRHKARSELLRLIHASHMRLNFFLRELADGGEEKLLLLGEVRERGSGAMSRGQAESSLRPRSVSKRTPAPRGANREGSVLRAFARILSSPRRAGDSPGASKRGKRPATPAPFTQPTAG